MRYICKFCGRDCKNPGGLSVHERSCKQNPNRLISRYLKQDYICPYCGKSLKNYTIQCYKRHLLYCPENPEHRTMKPMSEERKQKIRVRAKQQPYHHSEEIKQKLSQIAKDLKLGGYVKGSGRGKKGWYNGFWCDSTYELAYLIYCLDHGISIKRNWNKFTYTINGKNYTYIPDFIVNDTYIEIKGYYTKLVDIKVSCVNKPIKVLYGKDLYYVFNYIKEKYNKQKDKNIHELYNGITTMES